MSINTLKKYANPTAMAGGGAAVFALGMWTASIDSKVEDNRELIYTATIQNAVQAEVVKSLDKNFVEFRTDMKVHLTRIEQKLGK